MIKPSARLFPIGYIISVDAPDFNPHDFYIDGNWERIKGRVIVGVDENQTEFNVTGKTGGAKTHTLTTAQIPSHGHGGLFFWGQQHRFFTPNSGSDQNALHFNAQAGGLADDWGSLSVGNTGSGQPHNNLQPYQTAYVWKLISYSN